MIQLSNFKSIVNPKIASPLRFREIDAIGKETNASAQVLIGPGPNRRFLQARTKENLDQKAKKPQSLQKDQMTGNGHKMKLVMNIVLLPLHHPQTCTPWLAFTPLLSFCHLFV